MSARYGEYRGGAGEDAIAAGLNFFAQYMMNRQAKKEDRKARQEESDAYEKALELRQIKAEERAERKRATTPVERRAFQGSADQGPPELMVDELNAIGESVGQKPASQRERQDFATQQQSMAATLAEAREKQRIADEDRAFDRKDKETRTSIASRNADSSARRASAAEETARKKTPPVLGKEAEPAITTKDALSAIDRYRQTAADQEGKSWQDIAREDGVDPTGLLREANRGSFSAGPSSRGRPDKPEPILGKKADKPAPKKEEVKGAPAVGAIQIDEDDGKKYRFKGGNPDDPKNWVAI